MYIPNPQEVGQVSYVEWALREGHNPICCEEYARIIRTECRHDMLYFGLLANLHKLVRKNAVEAARIYLQLLIDGTPFEAVVRENLRHFVQLAGGKIPIQSDALDPDEFFLNNLGRFWD